MFCCPGTSSDSSPAVCRIRFSIASLRYRLLSFCYVMDDKESRSQGQCSAKHNGATRAHPDNRKMKAKKFSAVCAEGSPLQTSIHCHRQWSYHSKVPRTGVAYTLTPSHHHTLIPHTLTPHTLTTLSDPAAALPDAIRSSHHDSIESLITAQPREERLQSPSVPCLKT